MASALLDHVCRNILPGSTLHWLPYSSTGALTACARLMHAHTTDAHTTQTRSALESKKYFSGY